MLKDYTIKIILKPCGMNGNKKFIDTNLIIYFLELNEEFYPQVNSIFKKAETGEIKLFTSSLSYLEVLVPVIKTNNIELRSKYNYLFKGFEGLKVIDIDMEVAYIGAVIKAKYGIRTPDALQISCAIKAECDEFFTADARLKTIKEIKVTIIRPE